MKWLTAGYATMQILFIRGTVVALLALAVVKAEGGDSPLSTARPWEHAARGACNVLTIFLFMTAIARLPLADVQ